MRRVTRTGIVSHLQSKGRVFVHNQFHTFILQPATLTPPVGIGTAPSCPALRRFACRVGGGIYRRDILLGQENKVHPSNCLCVRTNLRET